MSIKASLYDFFAYTIPGVFYLAIVVYSLALFGTIPVHVTQIMDMSLIAAFFLVGAGYVTGMVMDYTAELWHRLFNPKGRARPAFESLQTSHPDFKPTFRASDWSIVLANLRGLSGDQATEIDRFNVYGIMLRNISLGLVILAVVHVIYFFYVSPLILSLVFACALLLLSVMAGIKGSEFRLWYYRAIFSTVVGAGLQAHDFFVQAQPPRQPSSSSNDDADSATINGDI